MIPALKNDAVLLSCTSKFAGRCEDLFQILLQTALLIGGQSGIQNQVQIESVRHLLREGENSRVRHGGPLLSEGMTRWPHRRTRDAIAATKTQGNNGVHQAATSRAANRNPFALYFQDGITPFSLRGAATPPWLLANSCCRKREGPGFWDR